VLEYASRLESSPGKRDGLYWPTAEGEEPSPLGTAVAARRAAGGAEAGYTAIATASRSQGKSAPGGAFDYLVRAA